MSSAQNIAKLREHFERAVPLDAAARRALIDEVIASDPILGATLQSMLHAHETHVGRTQNRQSQIREAASDLLGRTSRSYRPGTRIGAYELRGEIGRGGMGVVFHADRVDGSVRQNVAIKIVNPALIGTRGMDRFKLEREIVASFEHAYIARLYDAGETLEGAPYMVMERVEGEPITRYADHLRLSLVQRLTLFLKVCDAVQHAHERLVLHRDLKPSNILVTRDGTPKLIDFGIAKPMGAVSASETSTRDRFFSPANAAPEQLQGGTVGVTCDVYLLGSVLYELLCGASVFEMGKLSPAEVEQRILSYVPMAPSQRAALADARVADERSHSDLRGLVRELSGDLDSIVLHALRKLPSERYASVEQLAADLRNYLERRPLTAKRGHRLYRLRKFVRRNIVALVLVGLAAIALAGFVIALTIQTIRLQRERDSARADRDRADKSAEFMIDVFTAADPGKSLQRDSPISAVVENARIRLERNVQNDPALRLRLLGVLARVYETLGDSTRALALLDEANSLIAQDAVSDERSLIDYYISTALVLGARGRLHEATLAAGQAIEIQERIGVPRSEQWQSRSVWLHASLPTRPRAEWRDAYLDVLTAIEQDAKADPGVLAHARIEVGHNLSFTYDFALAERLIRLGMEYVDAHLPANHADAMFARIALANLYDKSGRSEAAIPLLDRVYELEVGLYGEAAFSPMTSRLRLVFALTHAGQYERAQTLLTAVVKTTQELSTPTLEHLLRLKWAQAELASATQRWREAEVRFGELLEDSITRGLRTNEMTYRARLGDLYFRQGRFDVADKHLSVVTRDTDFTWPGQADWAIIHAEVLHCLGREEESQALLLRMQPMLGRYPDALKKTNTRAALLTNAIAGSASRKSQVDPICPLAVPY